MLARRNNDSAGIAFERHDGLSQYGVGDALERHAVAECRRDALQTRQTRRRRIRDRLRRGNLTGAPIQFLVRKLERRERASQLPGLIFELARVPLKFLREIRDPLRIFGDGERAATIVAGRLDGGHRASS